MYLNNISNIERGTGNSGITDLLKLEMIAEYFGVTLVSFLTEEQRTTEELSVPANVKLKEYELKNYKILNVNFAKVNYEAIAEVQLQSPNEKTQHVSFLDSGRGIYFYQTRNSLFGELQDNVAVRLFIERHVRCCFLSGESYADIFIKAKEYWVDVCRFLVYVATEGEQAAKELVQNSIGKCFCDIEIPHPLKEPCDPFDVNWNDLSAVYRYRLMLETGLRNSSIMSDGDADIEKLEKATLEKLKAACASEDAYKTWKKDLLDAKVTSLMLTEKLVTCFYQFAGFGDYKEILPESEVEGFENWVNSCGSGFVGGHRTANKQEIQTYAALHIADDLQ